MSYAFMASLKKNPQQSYVQLLNSIRDELEGKYDQKPQLSCSHPLDTDLLFVSFGNFLFVCLSCDGLLTCRWCRLCKALRQRGYRNVCFEKSCLFCLSFDNQTFLGTVGTLRYLGRRGFSMTDGWMAGWMHRWNETYESDGRIFGRLFMRQEDSQSIQFMGIDPDLEWKSSAHHECAPNTQRGFAVGPCSLIPSLSYPESFDFLMLLGDAGLVLCSRVISDIGLPWPAALPPSSMSSGRASSKVPYCLVHSVGPGHLRAADYSNVNLHSLPPLPGKCESQQ